MPLVEVNNCQYILNMSKIMVHYHSKYESINQFEIGYMIKPSPSYEKVFGEQVEK